MKKEEIQKKLIHTKVYVNGKSEEIQKKLFELGFTWLSSETRVQKTNQPFLYLNDSLIMVSSNNMLHFRDHQYKEISVEDILSIPIEKEYEFKPFDKVLVRDMEDNVWRAAIFSHIDKTRSGFPYVTINAHYKYCIPYEGNESLLGTVSY